MKCLNLAVLTSLTLLTSIAASAQISCNTPSYATCKTLEGETCEVYSSPWGGGTQPGWAKLSTQNRECLCTQYYQEQDTCESFNAAIEKRQQLLQSHKTLLFRPVILPMCDGEMVVVGLKA